MIDKTFERLTVVALDSIRNNHQKYWLCKCECGNTKVVRGDSLKRGDIRSCGCLMKEMSGKRMIEMHTTHGKSGSPIYIVWKGIQARCNKPSDLNYHNYGGRGIKCLWESFEDFYRDMGDPPKGMTIDRINNDGNYEPKNCRWATKSEQANNRRTAHMLTYKGRTQNMKTWSKELGIANRTLWWRINAGWSVEKAFSKR